MVIMFGNINSWEQVGQIAEGWAKDALNLGDKELREARMAICKTCPLLGYSPILGEICDSKKCLDVNTNTLVSYPGDGIVCGCGCSLRRKQILPNAKCTLGKW